MDNAPAIIVDGLTSGGVYTIGSLRLMLTGADTSNWQPRFDKNFIDLAKSAKFSTFWFSNQGMKGEWDSPVSAIAVRSDFYRFLKQGGFDSSDWEDVSLLPYFEKKLQNKAMGNRLFVLHMMGSHPDACERVRSMPDPYRSRNPKLKNIACYISSIKQTDRFIRDVYNIVTKSPGRASR